MRTITGKKSAQLNSLFGPHTKTKKKDIYALPNINLSAPGLYIGDREREENGSISQGVARQIAKFHLFGIQACPIHTHTLTSIQSRI